MGSYLFFKKKQPMKAEEFKGQHNPVSSYAEIHIFGYFPLRHIKSKTTTDLKILVLVYSEAKALKLKCFRSDIECHKTLMKISYIPHHSLKKWKKKNAICDLGHQTNCRTYECHLPQEQTRISPHCTKLIYTFFTSSYRWCISHVTQKVHIFPHAPQRT